MFYKHTYKYWTHHIIEKNFAIEHPFGFFIFCWRYCKLLSSVTPFCSPFWSYFVYPFAQRHCSLPLQYKIKLVLQCITLIIYLMSVCLFYLGCKEVAFCRAMQFTCNCCYIGYSDDRTTHLSIYVMKNMFMYISLKQSTIFNQSSYFLSVICQNMVIISRGYSSVERVRTDQQIKYQIIFNLPIV